MLGEPVWTTTHGGYTLFLANNPVYYADVVHGPYGTVWSGPNQKRWWDEAELTIRGLSEPETDRALQVAAWRTIRENPQDFARASASRLGRFWGLYPAEAVYPRWLRFACAAWTAPLWVLVAVGLCNRSLWRWPYLAAPALLASYTLIHSVYWTDMRMRAPLTPVFALLAAAAIERIMTLCRYANVP